MEGFTLGCRVRDVADGTRATVKYIGPVAAAKNKTEFWLGVEWDKTGRGKHDGSCVDETGLLHRYFQCAMGDGSFVKANKVTSGRMLTDALKEKYVGHDAPATVGPDSIVPDAFVITSKGHQKSIEFVGELKLRKWQQIGEAQQVGIRDDTVSSIGDGIAEIAAFVTEMDLQDNLLWEWKEIASLAKQLPQLSTILLHGNKMQQLSPAVMMSIPSDSMRGLKVLALNSCNIKSWTSLQFLEPFLPSIEELYLALNDFSDLPKPEELSEHFERTSESDPATEHNEVSGFLNLRLLDFTSCKIDSWHQLLHFSKLPRLEELILDGNPISSILPCPCPTSSSANSDIAGVEAVKEEVSSFPSLQRMSLSCSKLSAWSDIDSLASYQSCRFLRLSQIPLFAGKGASEVRPLVIGRMPSLVFFNGSGISPRERTDAEKSYLRSIMFAIDDATAAGRVLDLTATHPRYEEIQAKYGADLLPMGKMVEGSDIASNLINVTINNLTFASGGSLEPLKKKLPNSITINRLKVMVKQLYGLDPHLQFLSLRLYKNSVPILLDDEMSTLGYYGAIDGAEIFINEAPSQ